MEFNSKNKIIYVIYVNQMEYKYSPATIDSLSLMMDEIIVNFPTDKVVDF